MFLTTKGLPCKDQRVFVCWQDESERCQNNLLISPISILHMGLSSKAANQLFQCVGNVMLKLQNLKAYLGYDLQHRVMKHLLDLCKNGKVIYYTSAHRSHSVTLLKLRTACMDCFLNFFDNNNILNLSCLV